MICAKCKKEYKTALMLFNGQTTCPFCKEEQLSVSDLVINRKNQELFSLSQIAFFRYLTDGKKGEVTASEPSLSKAELLKKAIELCMKSASLGHPKAILQTAYLLENFNKEDMNEQERILLACENYHALCFSDKRSVPIKQNAAEFTEKEFLDLKIYAGKNLLRVCKTYKNVLSNSNKFNYEKVLSRLRTIYKTVAFDEALESEGQKKNKPKSVFDILVSSRNKTRAPLFGLLFVSASEFKEVCQKQLENGTTVRKLVAKDKDFLRYSICNANGDLKDLYFSRLASPEALDALLQELDGSNDYLYLFFFNKHGKHAYLNGNQIKTVKGELEKNEQSLLLSLVGKVSGDVSVFFDDDIVQFKNGKNISKAVEDLIESISNEK